MFRRVGRRSLVVLLLATGLALAAARDVETRRFTRLARVLLLPDETATLKELEDEKDRQEFQRIFWARRDPTPATPENEFRDSVLAVWAHSDALFSAPGQKGSESGCGQVLALLGKPEEVIARGAVRKGALDGEVARSGSNAAASAAPGSGRQFDSTAYLRDGSVREPETWVYRDRPGLPYHFTGAELRIEFDSECRYAEGAGFVGEDLRKAAAAFVTRPDIAYARGSDGHLLPLAAASGASGATAAGARALLSAAHSDFPLAAEAKLLVRAPKGDVYVAGLVSAQPGASAGALRLSLAVQAADASGQPVASVAREVTAPARADGSVLASWGLALKPGRYTVRTAVALPDDKGSLASLELDVPDLGGAALAAGPLVLYPDEAPASGKVDPRDPFAAFQLGGQLLHPRFGNVFAATDALMVVATLYGAKLDAASGKAALKSRYSVLKDGRPVARGAEDAFATADAVASVGPIPLASYAPGRYVVRLEATDGVANQTVRQEASFEIRP